MMTADLNWPNSLTMESAVSELGMYVIMNLPVLVALNQRFSATSTDNNLRMA